MPKKPAHKMSIELRAKQFVPFDALSGYAEALRRVEDETAHNGETEYLYRKNNTPVNQD